MFKMVIFMFLLVYLWFFIVCGYRDVFLIRIWWVRWVRNFWIKLSLVGLF